MKNRRENFFKRLLFWQILLNITAIIAIVFLFEITLQAVGKTNTETTFLPHPALFWTLAPGLKNSEYTSGKLSCRIHTNRYGFRNEAILTDKDERSFRILCLGDEITFGAGVDQSDTYSKILQKMIRNRFHYYVTEVINAGVEGYSTYQGLCLLKDNIAEIKPDVIVISFLRNDYAEETATDKSRLPSNPALQKIQKILHKSRVYLGCRNFLVTRLFLRNTDRERQELLQRVPPSDFKKNLEDMANVASSANARLIFVLPPEDRGKPEPFIYRRIFMNVAEKNGYLVNLNTGFKRHPEYFFDDTSIPNEKGQKEIAEKIFEVIKFNNLMPSGPGQPQAPRRMPPGRETGPGQNKQAPPKDPGPPPGNENFYL